MSSSPSRELNCQHAVLSNVGFPSLKLYDQFLFLKKQHGSPGWLSQLSVGLLISAQFVGLIIKNKKQINKQNTTKSFRQKAKYKDPKRKYSYLLLFQSLYYAALLLQKTYISTCFH